MPKITTTEPFTYASVALRSPFKKREVIFVDTNKNKNKPDLNRPKEPLESFAMDSLNMVGVLQKGSVVWALVSTPDGNIHYVKPGDYMGRNYGKVVRITTDEINLVETVQGTGGWEQRPAVLLLGKSNNPTGKTQ